MTVACCPINGQEGASGVARGDGRFHSLPGRVIAADDVVVALAHNLAVLHDHSAKATTCSRSEHAIRGRKARWCTPGGKQDDECSMKICSITCALLQACNATEVDCTLHKRTVRVLDATDIDLLLVLAALAEVLQIHDSTGSAWDSVNMVLAAGHFVVGGLRNFKCDTQVYVAVVGAHNCC